ncbi:CD20-like domain-containing protein [Leuconostoc pseudomesenteroides]|uniref:CD20-like domain-containing protein n=1 Tax=Leuconostoc pseudomesenteroides TaxID=33968 RepID=UPI0039ECF74C
MTERKVLGILAIVFGGVGLVFSWVPFINNLAFVIGLIGFILGIIALILNRKNKKLLAIVGTVISFLSLVLVLVTQNSYSKAFDNATKSVSNSEDSSSKKEKSSSSSSSEKRQFQKLLIPRFRLIMVNLKLQ